MNWDDGNIGHSCLRGYYIFRRGHDQCSKIAGFTFYKISLYGITTQTATKHLVIDDVVILDSVVGIYPIITGPNPEVHEFSDKSVTIKNSYISGKGENFDCNYDTYWQKNTYSWKYIIRQVPRIYDGSHTALVSSDFLKDKNDFPGCEWWNNRLNVAMYGKTCVINTHFANYNGRCGQADRLVRTNRDTHDHIFPINFVSGNSISDVNVENLVEIHRPELETVNIADCSDLFCDALKKFMVIDEDGGIFGEVGTLLAESEHEWDGITRLQPDGRMLTYSDTQDGLGEYRIPTPMQTNADGSQIPMNQVYSNVGIVRNENCVWRNAVPGWWCPRGTGANELKYYDLVVESMDAD